MNKSLLNIKQFSPIVAVFRADDFNHLGVGVRLDFLVADIVSSPVKKSGETYHNGPPLLSYASLSAVRYDAYFAAFPFGHQWRNF